MVRETEFDQYWENFAQLCVESVKYDEVKRAFYVGAMTVFHIVENIVNSNMPIEVKKELTGAIRERINKEASLVSQRIRQKGTETRDEKILPFPAE